MFQSVINRAALGRAAKIGALYDVRTEEFLVCFSLSCFLVVFEFNIEVICTKPVAGLMYHGGWFCASTENESF